MVTRVDDSSASRTSKRLLSGCPRGCLEEETSSSNRVNIVLSSRGASRNKIDDTDSKTKQKNVKGEETRKTPTTVCLAYCEHQNVPKQKFTARTECQKEQFLDFFGYGEHIKLPKK